MDRFENGPLICKFDLVSGVASNSRSMADATSCTADTDHETEEALAIYVLVGERTNISCGIRRRQAVTLLKLFAMMRRVLKLQNDGGCPVGEAAASRIGCA